MHSGIAKMHLPSRLAILATDDVSDLVCDLMVMAPDVRI